MLFRECGYLLSTFVLGGRSKTLNTKSFTNIRFSTIRSAIKSEANDSSDHKHKRPRVIRSNYNDTTLSKVMLQVKSKRMRDRSNLIYFEGKRLLIDALSSGLVPLCVYFSKTEDIRDLTLPENTQLQKVPYSDLKLWTDLTTCPGILAVCKKPDPLQNYESKIPVSVICDNVREPGNLGAIIRNAAGAGVQNVSFSEGCTDLWDSKVIRGGMGSHFRIPLYNEKSWEDLQNSFHENTLFLIAKNESSKSRPVEEAKSIPYYNLDYTNYKDIALIIGGETEGISQNALNLANSFDFRRITIPLFNKIESLNNVSALSIILYEIKRQFDKKQIRELH